jgi:hypothetical protein
MYLMIVAVVMLEEVHVGMKGESFIVTMQKKVLNYFYWFQMEVISLITCNILSNACKYVYITTYVISF